AFSTVPPIERNGAEQGDASNALSRRNGVPRPKLARENPHQETWSLARSAWALQRNRGCP
ncbi:MAG: hypothetical protein RL885_04495, partial [Planctomycetota bacterium]